MSKCVCFTNDTHTLNENAVAIHPLFHQPNIHASRAIMNAHAKSDAWEEFHSLLPRLYSFRIPSSWLTIPLNFTCLPPNIATTVGRLSPLKTRLFHKKPKAHDA